MEGFLIIIRSLPTVVFTIMMGLMAVYWVTVIMGAVDIDLFDLDADLDADFDADLDVDLDLDADVDVDADVDADVDPGSSAGVLVSLLSALGLVGVPLTISMSILVLYNWALTFLGSYFLGAVNDPLSTPMAAAVLGVSVVASTFMTSLTIKPLKPLFRSKPAAKAGNALLGMTVKVMTGSVTSTFGKARAPLEGSVVNVSIRCDIPDNGIEHGDEVMIVGYDEARHVYQVEPMGAMMGGKSKREADLDVVFDDLERAEREETEQTVAVEAAQGKQS